LAGISFFRYALDDIKRQKIKTMFGVGGIAISILLLTIVGSLSDSLSYSYLDQATSQAGSADISFTRKSGLMPTLAKISCDDAKPMPVIYVKATSILFSLGKSTPAIRAKIISFYLTNPDVVCVVDFDYK